MAPEISKEMHFAWAGVPEQLKAEVAAAGGFCHRQPSTAMMQGQTSMGRPMLVRQSGFGLCAKELCPLWLADPGVCLDRAVALERAMLTVDRAANYPTSFAAKNLVPGNVPQPMKSPASGEEQAGTP